jgi:putative DNA primase/helicase
MALKAELGEEGFKLWDEWSSAAGSYNRADCRDTWRSIKPNGGIGPGTLYHLAQAHGWQANGTQHRPHPQELAERQRQAQERSARDRAETDRRRAEAAAAAIELWRKARPAQADHPYLARKGITPTTTLREIPAREAQAVLGYVPQSSGEPLTGRLLIVPVKVGEQLSTLELIDEGGRKAALAGGAKKCGYWAAQALPEGDGTGFTLLIGEGVATVRSAQEATEYPGIGALSAGNLPAVARLMRERYPAARLVILADLARATAEPDHHAVEAARAVGGLLAVPDLGPGRQEGQTDFNDLHQARGLDAVRRQVAGAQRVEAPDLWPEPQPLPDGLAPVEPFDHALLPGTLRPWVQDICDRVQCPPDYVGAAAITALAAALGRKIGIRPQAETDWTVVGNQWALIVGRPGVLKSPAMEAALGPLKRLAALACEHHEGAIKDHERALAVVKLRRAAQEKQAAKALAKDPHAKVDHLLEHEEIQEPALRRYIANDTTAAALGELLRLNPQGLLVHRDELVSLLRALDREDNAEARGFYLTAWNGDSGYTFDRIIRGMNLHIPAVCLSLLGSTQPGRVAHYVKQAVAGGAWDDGLIQRFGLLVWPDTGGEWRDVDRWPDTEAKRVAFETFQRLDQLVPTAVGALQDAGYSGEPDGVPYLRFDARGLGLFREWRQTLEAQLRGGELHPALESHLAKYRKLVPGLALLLHLAEGHSGPVGSPAVVQALAWAEYLETHARRAYGAVTAPEVDAAKAILFRLRRGDLKSPFSGWNVWRPGWASLSDRELVQDALQLLVDLDHLRVGKQETRGRTATTYTANPRTL